MDFDAEVGLIRTHVEHMIVTEQTYRPTLKLFDGEVHVATVSLREAEGDTDQKVAFTEACSLIPYMHADQVILSYDTFLEDGGEGVIVFHGERDEGQGKIMPYQRDDAGNFLRWTEAIEGENFTVFHVMGTFLGPLSHFLHYHAHLRYSEAMVRTLQKRGHQVSVPSKEHVDLSQLARA